jgi:hypothetical protein
MTQSEANLSASWPHILLHTNTPNSFMPLSLRQLVPEKQLFLTVLDICSQNCSSHKAVKFYSNVNLH